MIYLLETELKKNKSIFFALTKIYGINCNTSEKICKKLGFSKNFKAHNLSSKQINKFLSVIENSNILVNSELKKKNSIFLRHLVDLKVYRGLRKVRGLPSRGQRTRTNSRTSKNKKHVFIS